MKKRCLIVVALLALQTSLATADKITREQLKESEDDVYSILGVDYFKDLKVFDMNIGEMVDYITIASGEEPTIIKEALPPSEHSVGETYRFQLLITGYDWKLLLKCGDILYYSDICTPVSWMKEGVMYEAAGATEAIGMIRQEAQMAMMEQGIEDPVLVRQQKEREVRQDEKREMFIAKLMESAIHRTYWNVLSEARTTPIKLGGEVLTLKGLLELFEKSGVKVSQATYPEGTVDTEEYHLTPVLLEVENEGEFKFDIQKSRGRGDIWVLYLKEDDKARFIVDLIKGQN